MPLKCVVKKKQPDFDYAADSLETADSFTVAQNKRAFKDVFTVLIPGGVKSALHHWKRIRRGALVLREARIDAAHFLHGAYPSLKLAVLAAWLAGIKTRIADIHGEPKKEPWKGLTQWVLNRLSMRGVTHIKVLSECMKAQLNIRCRISRNVFVIPNSIDQNAYVQSIRSLEIRELYDVQPDESMACIVGRLFEGKGCLEVIEAAALPSLHRMHFFFVGEGPLESELKSITAKLGLEEKVHFLGFRNDVASILMEADFLIVPSYSEGAPLVVLEAMSLAKPVVATRVGAIPEMLGDLYPIKLINPGQSHELRDVLDSFCSLSREKRESVGKMLQNRVMEKYSKDKIFQEIVHLYA